MPTRVPTSSPLPAPNLRRSPKTSPLRSSPGLLPKKHDRPLKADASAAVSTRCLGDDLPQQIFHSPKDLELIRHGKVVTERGRPPIADHGLTVGVPYEQPKGELISDCGIPLHQQRANPRITKDHQLLVSQLEASLTRSSRVVDAGEYGDSTPTQRRDQPVDGCRHAVRTLRG